MSNHLYITLQFYGHVRLQIYGQQKQRLFKFPLPDLSLICLSFSMTRLLLRKIMIMLHPGVGEGKTKGKRMGPLQVYLCQEGAKNISIGMMMSTVATKFMHLFKERDSECTHRYQESTFVEAPRGFLGAPDVSVGKPAHQSSSEENIPSLPDSVNVKIWNRRSV